MGGYSNLLSQEVAGCNVRYRTIPHRTYRQPGCRMYFCIDGKILKSFVPKNLYTIKLFILLEKGVRVLVTKQIDGSDTFCRLNARHIINSNLPF